MDECMKGTADHSTLPVRVRLGHAGAPSSLLSAGEPVWFLTVCAEERGGNPLLPVAAAILDAACHLHRFRRRALRLCLVMPDHVHVWATLPPETSLARTVGDWKRFLALRHGIVWQRNFFRPPSSLGNRGERKMGIHPPQSGAEGVVRGARGLAVVDGIPSGDRRAITGGVGGDLTGGWWV